jgi:DNA-binding NarL/FixJ family response regulator
MSILIAEDNVAQRHYLREILEKEFPAHAPVVRSRDGEETVKLALEHKPDVCILDIQMPKLSGVKAARAIWRDFPAARIIFWTQFPHEIYINEIRKIVKSSIRRRPTASFTRTIPSRVFCVSSPPCSKTAPT